MLYIVGTPIGNLGDITLRALETLKSVDFILAEDTRVTEKLLSHFEIKKPLISYYEHNKMERGPQVIERLKKGENCALVSDAGMPGISDPGEHLISLCIDEKLDYTVVPGPCAFVTGIVLSGFPTAGFTFEGFLSDDKKKAMEKLERINRAELPSIIYEAPHNVIKTLKKIGEVCGGDRKLALARELTKIYEEVKRGTVSELLAYFENASPRGEYVIIIDGQKTGAGREENVLPEDKKEINRLFFDEVKLNMENGLKRNEALKISAKKYGISRNEAYALFEEMNDEYEKD